MDTLRLTLIIVGLLVVAGIYFKFRSSEDDLILRLKKMFSSENKYTSESSDSLSDDDDLIPVLTPIEDEPDFSDFEALSKVISGRDHVEQYTEQDEIAFSAVDETNETGPESLLIVLNIMSPKGHVFTGDGLHAVMISAGLTHGEHKIYHYLEDNQAVFSIANAVEPGFFELAELNKITTPGLAIFMQLPGPLECRKALETLLEISQRLASALSGELCDENRTTLTPQTISHMKEKVDAYRLKQQVAKRRDHT